MKTFFIWFIIIILIAGFLFKYLNDRGRLSDYNNFLNDFINNKPKIACAEDSDCHLTQADCDPCACGFAANKAWQPYCPFKQNSVDCKPCAKSPKTINIKCINTECKIVY